MQKHNIAEYFDIIIGTNPDIESKPSPMMIYHILQKAPFKQSVFVGNCLKDEQTAANAKIPYLQAKWKEVNAKNQILQKNEFSTKDELLAMLEKYE